MERPSKLGDTGCQPPSASRRVVGTVVVERLVRSCGVVVGTVGAQESAEMGLAQDQAMIQALAAKGADDPLDKRVLPGARGAMRTSWIPILLTRRANSSP